MSHPLGSLQKVIDSFQTNDIDNKSTTADVVYIGMESHEGAWLIKKIDLTTAATPVFTYASKKNNTTTDDYATAWAAIASLTYGTVFAALG